MRTKLAIMVLAVGALGFFTLAALHGLVMAQDDEKADTETYLGVNLWAVGDELAKRLDLDSTDGALIVGVHHGSPADDAGLLWGDVIVEFDGAAVTDPDQLTEAVRAKKPGDTVRITVLRKGARQTLTAKLGERKDTSKILARIREGRVEPRIVSPGVYVVGRARLGIQYQDLNPDLGKYFDRPDGKGVLVTRVTEDSAAAKAGMKSGDVIVKFGDKDIEDGDGLRKAMWRKDDENEKVPVTVVREGRELVLEVTLESLGAPYERNFRFYVEPRMRLEKGIIKERLERQLEGLKYKMEGLKHKMPKLMDEDFVFFEPEMDICIPEMDFEFAIPEIEVLSGEIMEDFFIDIPEIAIEDGGFHFLPELDIDFEGLHDIQLILEDGKVTFNGREFDSMEKLKEFLRSDEFEKFKEKQIRKDKEREATKRLDTERITI